MIADKFDICKICKYANSKYLAGYFMPPVIIRPICIYSSFTIAELTFSFCMLILHFTDC